jgi:hypothetical protein
MASEKAADTASERELHDLLRVCVRSLTRTFLVLDAFDECSEQSTLFRDCMQLAEEEGFRLIIFSRPTVSCLRNRSGDITVMSLSEKVLSHDIEVYLNEKMNR